MGWETDLQNDNAELFVVVGEYIYDFDQETEPYFPDDWDCDPDDLADIHARTNESD